MSSKLLLRIAACLTFLHALSHTWGVFSIDADIRPEDAVVLNAMKSHHFDVMGWQRTFWDFFLGFGLAVTVFLLLLSVLLWQIGTLATVRPRLAQPMIASFFVAWLGFAILDWCLFFPAPLVASILLTLLIGGAWIANRKAKLSDAASTNLTQAVS
jgi:hypothetical protein